MQRYRILLNLTCFFATLLLGAGIVLLLEKESNSVNNQQSFSRQLSKKEDGSGFAACGGNGKRKLTPMEEDGFIDNSVIRHYLEPKSQPSKQDANLKLIHKSRPEYTMVARENDIEGMVMLRVVFLANGEVGGITVVSGLPDGLTEEAVKAARKIKFEPAIRNGAPVTVTKTLEYSFTLY